MRHVLYSVAASLDGYIARPDGGYDWIPEEPEIDWAAFMERFDTVLMGRRTYEVVAAEERGLPDMETIVFSRTLDSSPLEGVTVTDRDPGSVVAGLRERPGKEIWLMGGGRLFRSLLDVDQVDRVELAVVPVLLGDGIPLLAPGARRTRLELTGTERYPSGIVLLRYDVV